MDIFILSDGKEIGPFSEETAQTLMKQGSVAATDLAWRSGMADWAPLGEMLSFRCEPGAPEQATEGSAEASPGGPPPADTPQIEPATAKQRAFLAHLAIGTPDDLSMEEASVLLKNATEDPALAERISKWSEERLRLHPDLFAAEIHARKESRANHFFEICQTEGARYFTRITKAHCQVLVAFLDVKFPSWDSRMQDAASNYFFPAIAEKFPQLIERQWKDHFHYAEGPGTESIRKAPTTRIGKRPVTPLVAISRGCVIGVAVLGALYLGQRMLPRWMASRSAGTKASEQILLPSNQPPSAASTENSTSPAPLAPGSQNPKKKDKTSAKKRARAEPVEDSPVAAAPPAEKAQSDPSGPSTPPASSSDLSPAPAAPAADNPAPASAPSQEAAARSKSNLVLTKAVELSPRANWIPV
jgi:hypothetical protein